MVSLIFLMRLGLIVTGGWAHRSGRSLSMPRDLIDRRSNQAPVRPPVYNVLAQKSKIINGILKSNTAISAVSFSQARASTTAS